MQKNLLFVFMLVFAFIVKAQGNLEEVIYLKNGSVIRGTIVEQIPNQTVKIQTKDGNVFVYNFSEVEKITKEENVTSPVSSNNYNTSSSLISAKVISAISSENNDEAVIAINNDVYDNNGKLLIKAGTPIQCTIEKKKRKGVGKEGSVAITFNSVKSVNGEDILLSGNFKKEGENLQSKALGVGLGVGLMLFTPMLAYIAKKGEAAIIPADTVISNISIKK